MNKILDTLIVFITEVEILISDGTDWVASLGGLITALHCANVGTVIDSIHHSYAFTKYS